jgi:peptidoglycan/xylan/chitin deacetylase (PgdA/CDA1 family)
MLNIIKTLNISHTPEPTNSEPADTEPKVVALTFDDGPNPHATPQILDILKSENIKATFFLIGKWVKKYPELARRIASEGHAIGGHTYSHGGEDGRESWGDFKKGNDTIKEITGLDVQKVRVPQFGYNEIETIDGRKVARIQELTEGSLAEDIASGKLSVIDCSINPNDWNVLVPSLLIREYVLFRLHPGAIICLHDGSENESELKSRANRTVRMLPDLIQEIKKKGYGFVTC